MHPLIKTLVIQAQNWQYLYKFQTIFQYTLKGLQWAFLKFCGAVTNRYGQNPWTWQQIEFPCSVTPNILMIGTGPNLLPGIPGNGWPF